MPEMHLRQSAVLGKQRFIYNTHDKALNIAKNPEYDGYQCGIVLMVYKCFDKKRFW